MNGGGCLFLHLVYLVLSNLVYLKSDTCVSFQFNIFKIFLFSNLKNLCKWRAYLHLLWWYKYLFVDIFYLHLQILIKASLKVTLKTFLRKHSTYLQGYRRYPRSTIQSRPWKDWGQPASCRSPTPADSQWTSLQRVTRVILDVAWRGRQTYLVKSYCVNDLPPHVCWWSFFHLMYPNNRRQFAIWEMLLAIADPL